MAPAYVRQGVYRRCDDNGYYFRRSSAGKSLILKEIWLGAESNRRHEDFQSSALPTELPSLNTLAVSKLRRNRSPGDVLGFSGSAQI